MSSHHVAITSNILLVGTVVAGTLVVRAQDPTTVEESAALPPSEGTGGTGDDTGSALSARFGFDLTDRYFFRGIPQENQGVLLQPYGELNINLYESEGPISSVDLYFVTWNSVHSSSQTSDWYESDNVAGLMVGLPLNFSTGVEYASIYSPTFGELIDEEVVIKADWHDSAVFERLPVTLSPGVLFAFETSGASDGARKGNYFEFHAAPTYTLPLSDDYPLDLSVPVRVGINMNRYYEDDLGNDDIFGFVDIALAASAPMAFVPERFGSWSLSASVHYIRLGNSAARVGESVLNITDGGRDHFYFMVGPTLEF